ncbi:RDD family protein [Wolbachia endosymbiont of Chironomus riparius]|uniref:RDD family protein n=1 Tax=Wolbachia endosymbiont of Chironomus riparius TaxID=2883238 RepID=UPI0020A0109D|nr:RDD family protein [Wolbachia endosymbiont of Chironomus riparius]
MNDTEVKYAGVTRRTIAATIDRFFWVIVTEVFSWFTFLVLSNNNNIYDHFFTANVQISLFYISMFYTINLFVVLEILMITRFGGTPGQLLSGIRIKDESTFKNITLAKSTIRCISREVILNIIFLLASSISGLFIGLIPLIVIFAIFDRRKKFFHDRIAKTVAIVYKAKN